MAALIYQHPPELIARWPQESLAFQMGNIGSEVSRSLRWYGKNEKRFWGACARALELFDLSIEAAVAYDRTHQWSNRTGELCRAREEFCDYFFGGNSWGTDPVAMQRYYDQFVSLIGKPEPAEELIGVAE